jgi:dipeptidyl aminopeptidase/acylaminoacyl peptidase
MSRWVFAASALAVASITAAGGDPQPAWELAATGGDKSATPDWVAFSPDGKALVVVVVREGGTNPPEYAYQIKVYDARTQKERFAADLGTGKTRHPGDELASFPTDDTVLTGGRELVTRNLETGNQTGQRPIGGLCDHVVWAVPDLKETFLLRRDPGRHALPVELLHRGMQHRYDEFSGRRYAGNETTRQVAVRASGDGLRAEAVAMNPGRTRLAVGFRDESGTTRRHVLALYQVRTVEDFDLEAVTEVDVPHPGPVVVAAFARNGQTLATGGEDGSVCLWDVEQAGAQWRPRATISGMSGHRVAALAFSHDWRYLAAATWDRAKPNLLLIDADEGRLVRAVRTERILTAVAWSPDGRTLVTAGASGTLKGWDAESLLKGE